MGACGTHSFFPQPLFVVPSVVRFAEHYTAVTVCGKKAADIDFPSVCLLKLFDYLCVRESEQLLGSFPKGPWITLPFGEIVTEVVQPCVEKRTFPTEKRAFGEND